jgi:Na+-translocating ferredoxin:NAD+ oxidoreductase subunit E
LSARDSSFTPNPLLAGMLGICPIVAADKGLPEGMALGLGAAICSLALGAVAATSRSLVPDRLRALFSLAVSTAIALLYGFAVRAYSPALAEGLGIFLPLLAVSALSLHSLKRGSPAAGAAAPGDRYASIAKEAASFLAAAILIGALREILGRGTLTIPLPGDGALRLAALPLSPLRAMASPAGGFMLVGCLAAAYRLVLRAAGRKLP